MFPTLTTKAHSNAPNKCRRDQCVPGDENDGDNDEDGDWDGDDDNGDDDEDGEAVACGP